MIAPILHKHIDEMDAIDAKVKVQVDKFIANLDIKALMKDPYEELGALITEVDKFMQDEIQPLAHKQGLSLAKAIDNKEIKIDPSKDPTKNQGEIK